MYCMQQFLLVWILLVIVMSFIKCVLVLSASLRVFGEAGAAVLWVFGFLDGQSLCCTNP